VAFSTFLVPAIGFVMVLSALFTRFTGHVTPLLWGEQGLHTICGM